jgi:hypothetical protein
MQNEYHHSIYMKKPAASSIYSEHPHEQETPFPDSNGVVQHLPLMTTEGVPFEIPEEGNLGILAMGYVGIMFWREKRFLTGGKSFLRRS